MRIGDISTNSSYTQLHDSAFGLAVTDPIGASEQGELGMIRYNHNKKVYEGYINNEWNELVSDAMLFGVKGYSGSGNITREALKNILGQLYKTADGTIHVVHGGGPRTAPGAVFGISSSDLVPIPSYIQLAPINGNTLSPQGLWTKGGNNFAYYRNVSNTRVVDGSVIVDLPGLFKLAKGPTAQAVGGVGAELIVGTREGKIIEVHVSTGGTGYSVGDPVSIFPGSKYDDATGIYKPHGSGATAQVKSVGGGGDITEIEITNMGSDYPPEEKYNFIFDVVSGLAGNSDRSKGTKSQTTFMCHATPAWNTSPDGTLAKNTDQNYGKYMFTIQATAMALAAGGFHVTLSYMCTLYKFKEFSNLT